LNLRSFSKALQFSDGGDELLDCKLPDTTVAALGLVDTPIGAAADKSYNLVTLIDSLFGVVPGKHGLARVRWVWQQNEIRKTKLA
jgi:hypothetical protein